MEIFTAATSDTIDYRFRIVVSGNAILTSADTSPTIAPEPILLNLCPIKIPHTIIEIRYNYYQFIVTQDRISFHLSAHDLFSTNFHTIGQPHDLASLRSSIPKGAALAVPRFHAAFFFGDCIEHTSQPSPVFFLAHRNFAPSQLHGARRALVANVNGVGPIAIACESVDFNLTSSFTFLTLQSPSRSVSSNTIREPHFWIVDCRVEAIDQIVEAPQASIDKL